ncbi:hypothetical protein WJX72_007197 [[Myrmecia] bisecta]|uniref:Uncharacterized protein n=1 Tax=[Myrmecia] bisecta TaxID=41462 RepID=A0AAW1QRF2_9CHLO
MLGYMLPDRIHTEGATASLLQEYLDRLDIRKLKLLSALYGQAAQAQACETMSATGQPNTQAAGLDTLANLCSSGILAPQVAKLFLQQQSTQQQLLAALAEAAALRVAAELQQQVADFEALVQAGSFREAAQVALAIEQAAARGAAEQQDGSPPSGQQHGQQHAQLQQVLSQHIAGLIAADPARCQVVSAGSPGALEQALLSGLRLLAEHAVANDHTLVARLGEVLWPQLSSAYSQRYLSRQAPRDDSQLDSFRAVADAARAFEASAVELGFAAPPQQGAAGRIDEFIKHALNQVVHRRRLQLAAEARELLLRDDAGETCVVGQPLPVDPAAMQRAMEQANSGLDWGTDSGVPDEDAKAGAGDLQPGLNWGLPGEEGPLLAAGVYRISSSAAQITYLLHAALTEACQSRNAAILQSMAAAIRDIVALMIALPPVVHAERLKGCYPYTIGCPLHQVPHFAALHFNACQHVASQLLLLPQAFEPRLSQLAGAPLEFIRDAQDLRNAGWQQLQAQVQSQLQEVLGILDGASHFRNVSLAQRGITARKIVQQVLYFFRHLGGVLRDVLAPHEFVLAASALLQAVSSRITDDLLAIPDISVEESEDLPNILQPFVAKATAAFLGSAGRRPASPHYAAGAAAAVGREVGLDQGEVSDEVLVAAIKAAAPALTKLQAVLRLMDMRLVEIQRAWQDDRLQQAGLSVAEACHLVEALFEDTDLRREVLNSMT